MSESPRTPGMFPPPFGKNGAASNTGQPFHGVRSGGDPADNAQPGLTQSPLSPFPPSVSQPPFNTTQMPGGQPFYSGQNWPSQSGVGNGPGFGSSTMNQNMPWPLPNGGPGKAGKQRFIDRLRAKRDSLSTRKKILLLALLLVLLVSLVTGVLEGMNGYVLYNQAHSGITHLQTVQSLFSGGSHGNLAKYLDVNKLRQAQTEIAAAHSDFQQLSTELNQDGSVGLLGNMLPQQIGTARSLARIGVDVTEIGQQVIASAVKLAPSLTPILSNPLGTGNDNVTADTLKPYITQTTFDEIYTDLNYALPRVHDINQHSQGLALNSLPISDKQRQLLTSALTLMPTAESTLTQISGMKSQFGWLLGVGQPRTFLVEPMDRAELRATGGFTGQFGEVTLSGGHMTPLKLKNIALYEENITAEGNAPPDPTVYNKVIGQTPPAPYSNWWPIGNFGMRDANLSADFPTSANLIMNRYQYEFGTQLDGVILFTPTLISHILHITGPITISQYNETITEQNLEDRLHYYQLDNAGIRKEELIEHVDDPQQARKLFTQRVTSMLISQAQHLPSDKMLAMVNEIFLSMKSKDLQVYMTNPQVESLIGKYGSTGSLDRSTNHDGVFVVQSNLSASKASQYVSTTISDTIALDATGAAKHTMQITLDYQKKGDVFGFDTYRDYMRIYVPPNSQFVSGNGFDQSDEPYCGANAPAAGYRSCAQDVYGDGTLMCPANVEPGYATSMLDDPYPFQNHPLDRVGAPQNQQSDETGRAMYGGWVVVPANCTMKVTLSWTVPASAQQPYSLLFQRQAGTFPQVNVTLQPAAGTCGSSKAANLQYSSVMSGADTTFTLNRQGTNCSLKTQS